MAWTLVDNSTIGLVMPSKHPRLTSRTFLFAMFERQSLQGIVRRERLLVSKLFKLYAKYDASKQFLGSLVFRLGGTWSPERPLKRTTSGWWNPH